MDPFTDTDLAVFDVRIMINSILIVFISGAGPHRDSQYQKRICKPGCPNLPKSHGRRTDSGFKLYADTFYTL